MDTDIQDGWEADVEDLDTSDEEWAAARAKVGECKKQKGSVRIDNAQQVGKQDMTADKSSISGIEQRQLGSSFHSDYETSEAKMDTDGEIDEDVPRLLRKKEKPIKVDEHTDFKKLKWQVGMTFRTVQGFKDVISSFAIAQGYDLKIGISDSRRRRVGAVCKHGSRFRLYASWDKSKVVWVVRIVNNRNVGARNMVKNRQLKYTWIASPYLLRFKQNPTWPAKELVNAVKKDYRVVVNKWTAYKAKQATYGILHGSMFDHYSKLGTQVAHSLLKLILKLSRTSLFSKGCFSTLRDS